MRRIGGNRRTVKSMVATIVCLLLVAGGAFAFASKQAELSAKRKGRAVGSFVIRGTLDQALSPGNTSRVTVSIANNRKAPIWVTRLRLSIAVDKAHAAKGCFVRRDYVLTQLTKKSFPIRVPANRKIRIKRGKVVAKSLKWRPLSRTQAAGRPTVTMLNLPGINQDACKGATLNLKFNGKATTKKPKKNKLKKVRR